MLRLMSLFTPKRTKHKMLVELFLIYEIQIEKCLKDLGIIESW